MSIVFAGHHEVVTLLSLQSYSAPIDGNLVHRQSLVALPSNERWDRRIVVCKPYTDTSTRGAAAAKVDARRPIGPCHQTTITHSVA